MTYRDPCATKWTRREALGMLGIGAAAALPRIASAEPSFPEGAVIRTILRDYPPEELNGGATLFHEHMSLAPDFLLRFRQYAAEAQAVNRPPNAPQSAGQGGAAPPPDLSFMRDLDLMTEELATAKREGIACIVDAGHSDMGRDIGVLRQLSVRSGMPIVAGGGFYTQPFYPREISAMSEEQISQALIEQAEADPIGAFGEVGSWDYITKDERKVFRAIGRAHLATNIPIFTHTGIPGKSASSNSTSSRTLASSRSMSSSAISETWLTRIPKCTAQSAGVGRTSALTARVVRTTIRSCQS